MAKFHIVVHIVDTKEDLEAPNRILIVIGNSNPPFTILSDREKR